MSEVEKLPESTGEARVPVIAAPTRSQTNLATQAPCLNKQPAGQEAIRPPCEAAAAPTEQGRRRGDLPSIILVPPEVSDAFADQSAPPAEDSLPEKGNRWRSIAIAGWLALALVCTLWVPMLRVVRETATTGPPAPPQAETPPVLPPSPVVGWRAPPRRIELPADPEAALTAALDHLNTALEEFPERSPEQILREISRHGQGCTLAWTNNLPSLVYGREPLGPNSLAYTLEDCAEAVSRMHR